MTVPVDATWFVSAKVEAHTAVLALLAGGSIKVRSASDALLATLAMGSPAGTVASLSGQVTLASVAADASASGTAAYGELCDSAGVVVCALPCAAGVEAVANRLVLNSLALLVGGAVTVVSGTIG